MRGTSRIEKVLRKTSKGQGSCHGSSYFRVLVRAPVMPITESIRCNGSSARAMRGTRCSQRKFGSLPDDYRGAVTAESPRAILPTTNLDHWWFASPCCFGFACSPSGIWGFSWLASFMSVFVSVPRLSCVAAVCAATAGHNLAGLIYGSTREEAGRRASRIVSGKAGMC